MYFTLMFADWNEGPSRTYDLVFHPCPVWMKGNEIILTPNKENPRYEKGSLKMLIEKEKIGDSRFLTHRITVVIHYNGNGEDGDLERLVEDIENEGMEAILWNLEAGDFYENEK